MGLAFEQQARESLKAFSAFRMYLEMGPDRSLRRVAEKMDRSTVWIGKWSKKHDWTARVQAHADYLANLERVTTDRLVAEKSEQWESLHEGHRQAEWKARTRLLSLAERVIERWERNEGKMGTLEGIARLLELASKLGRVASGMPEVCEPEHKETPTMRIEVALALEKIYGDVIDVEVLPRDGKDGSNGNNGAKEAEEIGGSRDLALPGEKENG